MKFTAAAIHRCRYLEMGWIKFSQHAAAAAASRIERAHTPERYRACYAIVDLAVKPRD